MRQIDYSLVNLKILDLKKLVNAKKKSFDLQEWKENLLNHCYCFFHGTAH